MKRLRELREAKKLSQQAFAEFFHITQQSVYKYEHGLAYPDIEIISQMADFFDTSIDYLVGASDVPLRYELVETTNLSSQELRVLEYYRRLSPDIQELIQKIILSDNHKTTP